MSDKKKVSLSPNEFETLTPQQRGELERNLSHLVIRANEAGGHTIEHHTDGAEFPNIHVQFGPGERERTLLHVATHAHLFEKPSKDQKDAADSLDDENGSYRSYVRKRELSQKAK
jgi:hypothetical protein